MGNLLADRTDVRRFHHSQAVEVTYFGRALESAVSGYGMRLCGTGGYRVFFDIDMGSTDLITVGDLTEGCFLSGQGILHTPGLTSGSLVVSLPAHGGEDAVANLVTVATMTAPIATNLATPILTPLPITRPLQIQVTGGEAGERALYSLPVHPIGNGWF